VAALQPGLCNRLGPCLEASNTYGFIIGEAEVTWGICPACQMNTTELHPEHQRRNVGES
jgi:hypothetical protein